MLWGLVVSCGVLWCVAACCRELWCDVACCRVSVWVSWGIGGVSCGASVVCCRVLLCGVVWSGVLWGVGVRCGVLWLCGLKAWLDAVCYDVIRCNVMHCGGLCCVLIGLE